MRRCTMLGRNRIRIAMFWKSKSPLTSNDEDWQIECWRWLIANFEGLGPLGSSELILPTREFFPATDRDGHERVEYIFGLVTQYLSVPEDQFEIVPQEESIDPKLDSLMLVRNAPSSPAGTFQARRDGKLRVTYDPALMTRPDKLIATLAHEICHPLLMSIVDQPPGGEACEEFATDLAVSFFGFGLFGANCSFEFQQFSDMATMTQGWSTNRLGYLTEAEWGFSLAVFLTVKGQSEDLAMKYLKNIPSLHLKKGLKYLRDNPRIIESLIA